MSDITGVLDEALNIPQKQPETYVHTPSYDFLAAFALQLCDVCIMHHFPVQLVLKVVLCMCHTSHHDTASVPLVSVSHTTAHCCWYC